MHLEKLVSQAKRLDRVNLGVAGVLKAMQRDGCALHCELAETGQLWWLSNGQRVRSNVARIVVINPNIVNVDTALFAGAPAQTYRWVE
jgi:ABC-type taurine transport system ATPase subunit